MFYGKGDRIYGYDHGKDGIRLIPEMIRIVRDCPKQETLTEIRRLIGPMQLFRGLILGNLCSVNWTD